MNFKDWEKISEDGKTCTLRHPKGHTMQIAMKALPKIQQEQIKMLKMAEGGKVERKPLPHGESATKEIGERNDTAQREYVKSDAGKPVLDKANAVSDQIRESGKKRTPFADGTPDGDAGSTASDASQDSSIPQNSNGDHTTNVYVNPAPAPTATPPVPPIAQYAPPAPPPQISPQPPGPITPQGGLQNQAGNTLQGISAGQQAIQAQQGVDIAKAQAAIPADVESIQKEQEIAQQNALAYQDLKKHTDDFKQYIDENPINPRHYQESMGGGQKAASSIGLMLGGLSVPFGGHNFAFDALQNQINRDVDAQKKNAENQHTVWGSYKQLYDDNNVATALAKASTNDIYAKRIQLAAHQVGTPQAIAIGLAATQKLATDSEQQRQNAAALVGSKFRGQQPNGQTSQGAPIPPQGNRQVPINKNSPSAKNKNVDEDIQIGAGGKPVKTSANQTEKTPIYSILKPGSDSALIQAQYNPLTKGNYNDLLQQYTQAQQVEKVLNGPRGDGVGGVHELMQKMHSAIGGEGAVSGFGTHVRRAVENSAEAVPVVGQALRAATELYPKGDAYKTFLVAKGQMEADLGTALQNLVTPTEIHHLVEKYAPEYLDSKEDVAMKEKAIVSSAIKAARTSLLQHAGMLKND